LITFKSTVETLSLPYVNGSRENSEQGGLAIQELDSYTQARTKYGIDAVAEWTPIQAHPAATPWTNFAETVVLMLGLKSLILKLQSRHHHGPDK